MLHNPPPPSHGERMGQIKHGRANRSRGKTVERAETERDKSENRKWRSKRDWEEGEGVKSKRRRRERRRSKEQKEEEEAADEKSQRALRRQGRQMVAMVMAVRHDIVFEGATDRQTERQRSRELL